MIDVRVDLGGSPHGCSVDHDLVDGREHRPLTVVERCQIEPGRSRCVDALDELTVMRVTRELLMEQIGLYSYAGDFVRTLAERFRQVDARLGKYERDSMPPSMPPPMMPGRKP